MRCKLKKELYELFELYVIVWRTPKNVFVGGVLCDDTKNGCVADYADGKSLLEDEITLAALLCSFKSLFNDSFNSQHDQITLGSISRIL